VDPWWAPWRADPKRAGVLLDFDGTLAAIVDDPADARPLSGVVDVLAELAARYRVVAVVSGRPVAFLAEHIGAPAVILSGQYGLEQWRDGRRVEHPDARPWRDAVSTVADRAEEELPTGVGVERKGLSVTLHVRVHPEHERIVAAWARAAADGSGLVAHRARRSWELRPPVTADKGTVVTALASGLAAVCFIGDDRGDVPAFAALDRLVLSEGSTTTRRIAVASDEAPAELLAAADEVVVGPEGVVELLRALIGG
jgi:trehalose 6-phosphate phosphatase